MNPVVVSLLAAGLVLAAVTAACAAEPPTADGQARAVVRPHQQAVLSSDIPGRIVRMPLKEGDRFKAGDLLVAFDCEPLKANQGKAKAELDRAQVKRDGLEKLASFQATGGMDVAMARADAEKARQELRGASLAVEHCVIQAPFPGRVVELKAHAFETVTQGAPLLAVLDDSALDVSIVIPSAWLGWLKPGQAFSLAIDETNHSHHGRITRFGAEIDPISQTITVYGSLTDPDRDIVPGMSGTARFARP